METLVGRLRLMRWIRHVRGKQVSHDTIALLLREGHALPFKARGMLQVQGDISRCECSAAGVEASLPHTAKAGGALCKYLQAHAIMLVVAQLFARGPRIGTEGAPNSLQGASMSSGAVH